MFFLWFVVLFYILGNMIFEYFCFFVESLFSVLKLFLMIVGIMFFLFGNGVNDVFVSMIFFMWFGDGDVGFNSVLGGVIFMFCFVVGVISMLVFFCWIMVDELSFIWDVFFIFLVFCCFIMIMIFGKISIWFVICFFFVYFLYIGIVFVM